MMKKTGKVILGIAVGCMGIMLSSVPVQAKQNVTIHRGVYIGNTDVSGMTQEEAGSAVEELVQNALQAEITLVCVGDHTVTVAAQDMGVTWNDEDIIKEALSIAKTGNVVSRYKEQKDLQKDNMILPLQYELDKTMISSIVQEKCDGYDEEAEDVGLTRVDGTFQTTEGKAGVILNNEAAVDLIYETLTDGWDGSSVSITLPTIQDAPKGSAEELAAVKDVLATFTTSYSTSSADRSANVANGCRLVNGTTLYPGDTFSMYDTIKPFTVENGYFMAGSYVNGMVVDSLGGGICQVSTTLYNAVLRAEIEVTERHNHSMIVSYVPASADAAIAESSGKDFKFTNNTDYPIYIEGITADKQITFNIYGVETRSSDRKVSYESEVLETINPTVENIVQTTSQPLGYTHIQSAHIGYKARLWKIVTVGGKEESREIVNSSSYKMVPRTITVGISTENADAYNQVQAAIASGSIDQVKAVSDAWAAQFAAQQQQAAQPPAEQPEQPADNEE